jgi:hypothetical protein
LGLPIVGCCIFESGHIRERGSQSGRTRPLSFRELQDLLEAWIEAPDVELFKEYEA